MMKLNNNQKLMAEIVPVYKVQFVLFGFRAHLTLQLEQAPVLSGERLAILKPLKRMQ
jgi:hypothetical protein